MAVAKSSRAAARSILHPPASSQAPPLTAATAWLNPASGLWSTAANWSGGIPTASESATISVAGTYAITIASTAAAASLLVDNPTATIIDKSILAIGTTLEIAAGHFVLGATGTLQGGTIAAAAGAKITLNSGATLSGVTYHGTLAVSAANQTLTIADGITLAGANGTGLGRLDVNGSGAELVLLGDTTLSNAILSLGLSPEAATILLKNTAGAQTLTLGPTLDLVQGNGPAAIMASVADTASSIINHGTITATSGQALSIGLAQSGGSIGTFANSGHITVSNSESLSLYADTLVNTGTILVTGYYSQLIYDAAGTWTNQGVIDVTNNGSIDLCGTFTTATLNSIVHGRANIYIGDGLNGAGAADLINTGTLSLAAYTAYGPGINIATAGVITGGTIYDPHGALATDDGTLSGVTYRGTLTVTNVLYVTNGITLEGATGAGPGTMVFNGGQLDIEGNATLKNATIDLSGGAIDLANQTITASQTLTLGKSLDLIGSGFISGESGPGVPPDTFINQGTITATGGALYISADPGSFTNSGTISVINGGEIDISGQVFNNTGTISITGSQSVLSLDIDWKSTGAITDHGGTVTLGGTFTAASLASITNNGGQIRITGDLQNTGTLAIGVDTPFNTQDFTGTISGGAISDPTGAFVFTGGTLSGVTYQGTLALATNDMCTIENGTNSPAQAAQAPAPSIWPTAYSPSQATRLCNPPTSTSAAHPAPATRSCSAIPAPRRRNNLPSAPPQRSPWQATMVRSAAAAMPAASKSSTAA